MIIIFVPRLKSQNLHRRNSYSYSCIPFRSFLTTCHSFLMTLTSCRSCQRMMMKSLSLGTTPYKVKEVSHWWARRWDWARIIGTRMENSYNKTSCVQPSDIITSNTVAPTSHHDEESPIRPIPHAIHRDYWCCCYYFPFRTCCCCYCSYSVNIQQEKIITSWLVNMTKKYIKDVNVSKTHTQSSWCSMPSELCLGMIDRCNRCQCNESWCILSTGYLHCCILSCVLRDGW